MKYKWVLWILTVCVPWVTASTINVAEGKAN